MRTLDADEEVVLAAMLQPLMEEKLLDREAAERQFGEPAVQLARALSQLGRFGLPADWTPDRGLESSQAESLRKMLVAVVGDVRLVVVKLAEQLQRMRAAKSLDAALRRKLAVETREVYAPLANRLGVWQVKWELEDLAFRYLQPADYQHIAAALKVRRSEREHYIEELKDLLQRELRAAGIEAQIDGRPKHIYSIWRKMQTKHLAFEEIMDIRAARILVSTVADCYAALGVGAFALAVHRGRVRRLHRDAEGQHVPLDSHRGARTGRAAGGDSNPDPRHARALRARRGGALALQGGRPHRSGVRTQDQPAAGTPGAGKSGQRP